MPYMFGRFFSKLLSLVFENPIARLYMRYLKGFMGVAKREPSLWMVIGAFATVAYFVDLYFQVQSFTGSWTGTGFLTSRTVFPWIGYALVCLFVIPVAVEDLSRHE